jgi:hypothetical protein
MQLLYLRISLFLGRPPKVLTNFGHFLKITFSHCLHISPELPRVGSGQGEKNFSSKGGPAKNIHTKSERLTVSCRLTWIWCEGVNLHNRQITEQGKTCVPQSGPRPLSVPPQAPISTTVGSQAPIKTADPR